MGDDVEVTMNIPIETYNNRLQDCTRSFTKTVRLKGELCLDRLKSNPNDVWLIDMLEHVSKSWECQKYSEELEPF